MSNEQLVEFVGIGKFTAGIMRYPVAHRSQAYCLQIIHGERPSESLCLSADDLLDLPRLTQLAAQALLDDGWLSEPLQDDLRCLLAAIELVESQPQPYFVCRACDAKWFGKRSSMPCPRCFTAARSHTRLLIPWKRDWR
jgi:hypothetical protein